MGRRDGATVDIRADADGVRRGVSDAERHLKRLGGIGQTAFAGLSLGTGIGAGLVAFQGLERGITDTVAAATEAQTAQAKLEVSVKNAGLSWEKYKGALDDALVAGNKLGFNDNQLRESLAITVRRTKDVADAWTMTNIAMDVARAKNIDLTAATVLVARAAGGNSRAIKALGIDVDKHATGVQILTKLQDALHGSAAKFAGEDVGKIAKFQAQWQHVQESVGEKVLPMIASGLEGITKGIAFLQRQWEIHHKAIEATARRVWADITGVIDFVRQHFGAVFLDIWHRVRDVFKLIDDLIHGRWRAAFGDLVSYVKDTAKQMWDTFVGLVTSLGSIGLQIGKAIGTGLANGLLGLVEWTINKVVTTINSALTFSVDTHIPGVGKVGLSVNIPTVSLPRLGGGGSGGGGGFGLGGLIPSGGLGSGFAKPGGGSGDLLSGGSLSHLGSGAAAPAGGGAKVVSAPGGAGKKAPVDLSRAHAFARAQVGKPYKWGGRGPNAWDCSGLAAAVAQHVPGYSGGWGITDTLYASSAPAQGHEPVVFGFSNPGATDHGSHFKWGHMGIKIEGTWYVAPHTGANVYSSTSTQFSVLRIPAGLGYLSHQDTTGASAPSAAAPSVSSATRKLLGSFPLGAAAMDVPSGPQGAAAAAISQAGYDAAQTAIAAGQQPEAIRAAKDKAVRDATRAWINGELDRERARRVVVNAQIGKLRTEIRNVTKAIGKTKGAVNKSALGARRILLRGRLSDLQHELLGINAYESELLNQAQDMDIDNIPVPTADAQAGGAAADTGITPDAQAQLDQANAQTAAAQAALTADEQFIKTALGPGDIGSKADSAWQAAGGVLHLTIQSLTPDGPGTLQKIADAVAQAMNIQGGVQNPAISMLD